MKTTAFLPPTRFTYTRRHLHKKSKPRVLEIGCGNDAPTVTKRFLPGCFYAGADIQRYNSSDEDQAAIDVYYPVGIDGSGYSQIPDEDFDLIILNHVIEHMPDPANILRAISSKLRHGGLMWLAFPSVRSLALPSTDPGALQFCDDPSHVFVPEVRELCNLLLANRFRILHAGRSWDIPRALISMAYLPFAFAEKCVKGKFGSRCGIWYLFGFEDHVLAKRI